MSNSNILYRYHTILVVFCSLGLWRSCGYFTLMKILSWNINSVRLRLPLLLKMAQEQQPDVICLQETKATDDVFPAADIAAAGYTHQLIAGMKSYNGVAILSRTPLKRLEAPNWCEKSDCRHIAAQLDNGIHLHNFYVPAGGDIPDVTLNEKFAHKLAFLDEMETWFGKGKRKAPRVLVGDLNVAPDAADVWSHKQLLDVVSHTPVETDKLNSMLQSGDWVDSHRHFTPAPEKLYSWWSYRSADWQASNRGRRLDHVWVTRDLAPALQAAGIATPMRSWEKPSDHVPVWATLKL